MEEDNLNSMQRDYDKDPIVIVDRMPEISLWFFIFLTLIPLSVITLWLHFSKREIDWTHLSISLAILYIPTFYFLKSRIAKNRKIIFYTNKIIRQWDDNILEFQWQDILSVKRSFIDFYDKTQTLDELRKKLFSFVLIPYFVLIAHPYLIVIKFFYKSIKGYTNISIYDTVVFFSKDNLMIGLFMSNKENYIEMQKYLLRKGLNINNLPNFYSTSYAIDELTYYFNKKDK